MEDCSRIFCVGLNGEEDNLVKILKNFHSNVYEVFGAPPPEISGSARLINKHVTKEQLRERVKMAHDYGVEYDVVLNSFCYSGEQFTTAFREKIRDFMHFLCEIDADTVTIADTALMEYVLKQKLPIKIIVSTWTDVTDPIKAKRFDEMGASRIKLHQDVNRDFRKLKQIKDAVNCDIELLINNGCTYRCASKLSHRTYQSHHSTSKKKVHDPYREKCIELRSNNPVEIIMSPTIRPKDLHFYEELGFKHFKIAGRELSTEWMLRILKAYINRNFDGNITDLCSTNAGRKMPEIPNKRLKGLLEFVGYNPDEYEKRCKEFYEKNIKK